MDDTREQILQGIKEGEQALADGRVITWDEAKAELRKWRKQPQ